MHTAGVGALPTRLLSFVPTDGELVPAWLSDRDRPWLRDLLLDAEAAAGTTLAALATRWRRGEPDPRAGRRAAIAQHVLLRLLRAGRPEPHLAAARQTLFREAARGLPHDEAVASAARAHGLPAAELLADLFADLPGERRVRWPTPPPEPSFVALLANRALAQGLLRHATAARLRLHGASRAVLRTAWLHGNGLQVVQVRDDGAELRWRAGNGMRHRSLLAIVPLLPWARRYQLRADCRVQRARGTFVLTSGDPLLPGPEPRLYDSALESAFARDFTAAAPGWRLLREPVPVQLPSGLGFPDFELAEPASGARWLCEIAGLRDRSALPAKLALLDHARCIVCLPHDAVPPNLRDHPRIVPFRRRVDAASVLRALQRLSG